jgi:hypothetical protein
MQHSIVCPNIGHSIVHHFGEGATVWGQAITPSIAHLVQAHRELSINYSRIRPGIVFESVSSVAKLPHILDTSAFRIHAEASFFRQSAGRPAAAIEAVIHCDVGGECTLKLWGRVTAEDSATQDQPARNDRGGTLPVIFTVTFWEISRDADPRMQNMINQSAEKDRKIKELEAKVALAMCSQ